MTWTGKIFKFNSVPIEVDWDALQADITAQADGDSGAPKQTLASMAANSVDTAELVAAAVSQLKLKTAMGEVSTSNAGGAFGVMLELPGGEYGFYPQDKTDGGATDRKFTITGSTSGATNNVYITRISIWQNSGSGSGFAQQRYIQASPPYDLGDGIVNLFIFCLVDKVTGEIVATYVAPEAPWHNNGPTDIRTGIIKRVHDTEWETEVINDLRIKMWKGEQLDVGDEGVLIAYMTSLSSLDKQERIITQEIKQADMNLIPHPFSGFNMTKFEPIMLDPLNDLSRTLAEMAEEGYSISQLIYEKFFIISNTQLSRAGPMGVKQVPYRWK